MAKKKKEQPRRPPAGNGASGYRPRLELAYQERVRPRLMEEFGLQNPMQVPRLDKIVLNMGLGEASRNIKILETAIEELAVIAGQRPVMTRARKSIAAFKLREGLPIGCRVTLRRQNMWHFFDRLVNVALPRVRDFRGVPTRSFDGRGSYTLGIRDHLIFPEVDASKTDAVKGMNITIVTTAANDEQALLLLRELGMPFVRRA
ncbi:MAG TPA: 50S ribosomal protein L5 [Thermoanaerobaculia bacterium]|nr:50S ribosomal protein L5 [Thermoanaerobaculia bacterium]